jgi:hypothetical protein
MVRLALQPGVDKLGFVWYNRPNNGISVPRSATLSGMPGLINRRREWMNVTANGVGSATAHAFLINASVVLGVGSKRRRRKDEMREERGGN